MRDGYFEYHFLSTWFTHHIVFTIATQTASRYEMASKLIAKLFPPKTPVVLHSLSSSKHNGLVGRCGRYDGVEGLCSVTLKGKLRKVSVKPENLRLLYPCTLPERVWSCTHSPPRPVSRSMARHVDREQQRGDIYL